MTALVVVTAAVLGLTVVAGLSVAVVFLVHIRRFTAEAAAALEAAEAGASLLAGCIERTQQATQIAASGLAGAES